LPLAQRNGERVLHRILGEIDVSESPDEAGDATPEFLTEDQANVVGTGASIPIARQAAIRARRP
jgi:hypothetical protein